jgi:hypothetical protein
MDDYVHFQGISIFKKKLILCGISLTNKHVHEMGMGPMSP